MSPSQGRLTRPEDTGFPGVRQVPVSTAEVECQGPSEIRPLGRRIWHLDSETEIVLDRLHEKRLSPELDLRIPPCLKRPTQIQEI